MIDFKDFDIQMATDAKGIQRMQVVGISGEGLKTVVKEYDAIEFFTKEQARAFAAPKSGDADIGLKVGGAFALGLLVGGFIVYLYLNRQTILPSIGMSAPGAIRYNAPPPVQTVQVDVPRRPEYDPYSIPIQDNLMMHEYNRMFQQSERLEDMEF